MLSYQGEDGGFDGGWGANVDDTAMSIMALGKPQRHQWSRSCHRQEYNLHKG
ncbi:MAG: hypothetical protein ACOX2A_11690 [Tepidanaerobacteraceae bacterium]